MARVGRPTFSPEVAERIRRAIEETLAAPPFDGNRAELGRKLGLTGQAVGKIIGGGGVSQQTLERLAQIRGIPEHEITGKRAGAGVRPGDATREYVPLARYGNAELAAEVARREGVLDEAIEWVVASYDLPADAAPGEWLNAMKLRDAQVRRERKQLAQDIVRADQESDASATHIEAMKKKAKPKLPAKKR